ncbi:unnamed protein product, partial [Brachionus calyciflorus]
MLNSLEQSAPSFAQLGQIVTVLDNLSTKINQMSNDVNTIETDIKGDLEKVKTEIKGDLQKVKIELNTKIDDLTIEFKQSVENAEKRRHNSIYCVNFDSTISWID